MLASTLINPCLTLSPVTTPPGRELDIVDRCGSWPRSPVSVGSLPDLDAAGTAAVFGALGSPIRLRLLAVMQAAPAGEACVCDLVDHVGLSQSTVSHHLSVLVASGLVRRQRRGTWAWYALVPERLEVVRRLLVDPSVLVD